MSKYSFLNRFASKAEREAAEDVARMGGKAEREALEEAQRLAREDELAQTFNSPKADINEQLIIDPLTGKSARESAEAFGLGNELESLGERNLIPRGESPLVVMPKDIPAAGESTLKVGKLTNDAPIIDAEIVNPAVPENLTRMEQSLKMLRENKGKAAIGAGALGLGATYMMRDGTPPPAAPSAQVPPSVAPTAKSPVPGAQEVEPQSDFEKQMLKYKETLSKPSAAERAPAADPMSKVIDFGEDQNIANMEGLRDAQKRSNLAVLANQLGRAGEIFNMGAANNQSKAGLNAFDANIKDAESIPEQYLEQVKFQKEDPNSAVSKGFKQLAKSYGFEIKGAASASAIERQLPQMANIFNQQEAAIARKEAARESREARLMETQLKLAGMADMKRQQKEDKKELQKEKFTENFRKELVGGEIGKLYSAYQKSDLATKRIVDAIQNPSGYKDLGNLYGYLKSLDSDSAVREGELALGIKQGSVPERLRGAFLSFLTGEMVAPSQRQKMAEVIIGYANQNRDAYMNASKPVMEQANRLGIPGDELLRNVSQEAYKMPAKPGRQPMSTKPASQPVKSIRPEDVDQMSEEQVEAELKRRGL